MARLRLDARPDNSAAGGSNSVADQLTVCFEEASKNGDIAADADPRHLAGLLTDCWEGAALRSRLRREAAPLDAMLDFYFRAVAVT